MASTFTGPIQITAHKIFWRKGSGAYPGLPKFFGYPLLSQEWVKLRTSTLTSTFTGPIRIKTPKNYGEKRAWAYPGAAQIFWVPPIISGTGKATDFKFCRNIGWIGTKTHENFWEYRSSRGRSQGVPKIFRAPTHRVHCAVVFAMAQLSHEVPH